MDSTNIKKYIVDILTKTISINDIPTEHVSEVEEVLNKMSEHTIKSEMIKFDDKGQWSLDKIAKPGPALDYSTFNVKETGNEKRAKYDKEAYTWDHSDKRNIKVIPPESETSKPEVSAQPKIKPQSIKPKSALDTMANRGQVKSPKI